MNELILKYLGDGLGHFLDNVNWLYTICVILASWVFVTTTESEKAKNVVKRQISAKWKVLIIGIIVAGIFVLIWPEYRVPDELGKMFFGIFTAMGLYKFGVHKLLKRKS